MKRYLLTLAVSAALAMPLVADYLVIRINLGAEVTESAGAQAPAAGGGAVGGGGRLGGGGPGGRLGGGAGGGMALGGGAGGAGGPGGGMALGGGPGGGMALGGGPGGPAGPGGFGGPGNGMSLGGPPGGGARGGEGGGSGALGGGQVGGGSGMIGGGPIGGGSGMLGGGALGGGALGGGPGGNANEGNFRPTGLITNKGDMFIVATEVDVIKVRNSNNVIITHRWGQTLLNPEMFLPDRAVMQVIKVPKLQARLAAKRAEYIETGSKQYMKLADWMLENWNMPAEGRFSMQTSFEAYLNELNSLAANLSAGDKAKLDAMLAVRGQIAKPVAVAKTEQDLVNTLLPKLGKDYKLLQKGHFAMYYSPREDKQAEAKLNRLETAYTGIMYWFALQGRPLTIPNKQMVCVLVDNVDKFTAIRKMFDEAPLYADGFYSPLDNITILAPTRVDAGYGKFATMSANAESNLKGYGLDFKKLLADRLDKPALGARDDAQKRTDVITGQIFAIAKSAAIDEGDAATATYEAYRQIVAATGYMPRTVILPRSVREGLGSFFSTPKSSGDHNLPALWSGIGGEHWLHLPTFRKLADARKSGENAEVNVDEKLPTRHKVKIGKLDVMAVVTDRVFDRADKANKEDQIFLMQKAQAESWALTFYLMKQRSVELKKFYDELTQMPRDLELSPEVLEQAFGRAFDLYDATGEKLDKTKVEKFEKDWANYMTFANLTVETAEKGK